MCKITATQIAQDGQAIGQALQAIASVYPDAAVAAQLSAVGKDIVAATANWTSGSSLAVVEDAEQAAIVVLNAIPVTATVAPLVAVAFTALNMLLANSKTQTTQTGNIVADAHVLIKTSESLNAGSPWQNKATIPHHFMHSLRQDFEDAWNKIAKPLGVAEIKL